MRNRSNKRQSKTIKIPPCMVNLTTTFGSILPHSKPAPSQTPTTQSVSQTISRFIADLLFSVLLQLLFLLQVLITHLDLQLTFPSPFPSLCHVVSSLFNQLVSSSVILSPSIYAGHGCGCGSRAGVAAESITHDHPLLPLLLRVQVDA